LCTIFISYRVKSYLLFYSWFLCKKLLYLIFICKFCKEITLKIKSNFIHILKKIINISKINYLIRSLFKVIDLKMQKNMIVLLYKIYKPNYNICFVFYISELIIQVNIKNFSVHKKREKYLWLYMNIYNYMVKKLWLEGSFLWLLLL